MAEQFELLRLLISSVMPLGILTIVVLAVILFGITIATESAAIGAAGAFLSPPVAMSAFYLKGVAPKHVTLNQIFAGMMPYMIIVIVCMIIMYIWPGTTLWLPNYLYGGG